ncbi:MAG: glycosyltransferase [Comamonadaceae bacterium]
MINYLQPNYADHPGSRAIPRLYQGARSVSAQPDVSVLTPYFNTEDFFVETFVCLQAQSLQNWEWIIVDDGSTDALSVERLASVAAKDDRIRVVRQDNAGPSAARNAAFRLAQGRYVCLLDSDDMVEHTYLEKAVWFLDSNSEFAFCNSFSVVFGDQQYLWRTGFERGKSHLQANSGPPISVIRHAAFAACGGFDESIRFGHEDWDFWLAMAKTGHWGYTLQEYLQWYRKRGNGRFEQIMRSGDVNDRFERLMEQKYRDLEAQFPAPVRRHPEPYDTPATQIEVNNLLNPNAQGRRILFLIPWMVTGGADRVNLDLIEGLVARGHQVTICATLLAEHRWEHEFSRFTPDIFVLPHILRAADYPRFLAYLIASRRVDTVLITGSIIGYQLLPYLRACAPGVAFLDMCHVEEPHWLNGGHPRFGVGYQDALDLNIVTTQHLATWMQERGADPQRLKVMYTGIRTTQASDLAEVRARIRSEHNIPANAPVIVFAGRLCAQKRPALLAQILQAAHVQGLEFRALIVGDGELRPQLEGLIREYALGEKVHMLGSVGHQEWLNILVASDILLIPSEYEGISVALLEAMAAGVVPLVGRVGGQGEIVAPDAGALIDRSDHELADYGAALTRMLQEPEQLRHMSRQCRSITASQLSWSGMIDHFEALVNEAHRLRVQSPRNPISLPLGKELATLALENKRLGEAVDWLWNTKDRSALHGAQAMTTSAEVQAVTRFAVALSQTRLGRRLTRSTWMKKLAKWLLTAITRPSAD